MINQRCRASMYSETRQQKVHVCKSGFVSLKYIVYWTGKAMRESDTVTLWGGGGVELQDVYWQFTFDPWQPGDGETKYSVVKKQFYDYFLSSNIVNSSIHVDMQDIYVNMRVIMLTSDLFMSTCELIMLTCKIFVSTCQITMFTCKLSLTTCEITCTC